MKDYLLQFRDQAFQASFGLYKRLIPGSFVATFLIGLVVLLIVTPLTLLTLGYSATDFLAYQQDMQNLQKSVIDNQKNIEVISELYMAQFNNVQSFLALPLMLLVLFIYSWASHFYLLLSDNEIRFGSSRVMQALKQSFSSKILSIAGFFILYILIQISVSLIFGLIFFTLSSVNAVLAVLVGFVGFFVMLAFLLRFTIAIPAIVHGNMGIIQAISFSMSRLTWKRGAMLLLMAILSLIVFLIVAVILGSIFGGSESLELTIKGFILQEIGSFIISVLFITYFTAAMSTLYFRYSDDSTDDESEHLIYEDKL